MHIYKHTHAHCIFRAELVSNGRFLAQTFLFRERLV